MTHRLFLVAWERCCNKEVYNFKIIFRLTTKETNELNQGKPKNDKILLIAMAEKLFFTSVHPHVKRTKPGCNIDIVHSDLITRTDSNMAKIRP